MCRVVAASAAAVALTLGLAAPGSADARRVAAGDCRDVVVPVALAEGQPKRHHIYGRLCVPPGTSPSTIQVLVHGASYTHEYWDFPDPSGGTDRYSYVSAATEAGFATLAVDRIGVGKSSRPLGAKVTIESNAYTIHQVIQAIRDGRISNPNGKRFDNVVYVGHSYGSFTGWYEVSDYNDVDAAVFTGATEKVTVSGVATILSRLYPASLDPQFEKLRQDSTYLTTLPGTRYDAFYAPMKVDPAVVAYDEAHKATITATEAASFPRILTRPLDIRVPAMIVTGSADSVFCRENPTSIPPVPGGSGVSSSVLDEIFANLDGNVPDTDDLLGVTPGASDCSSAKALVADEGPHMGPNVPSVDGFVLDGAGHMLNMAPNAGEYFTHVQQWIEHTVGGSAAR